MTIKKALMLASVASMIDQFNIPNIQLLQSLGYIVDVVADFSNNPGTITKERAELLQRRLRDMDVKVIDIPIPRTINPSTILMAYKQISALLETNHYNLIHCHSPIGGALCRVAANKERTNGTKVIYTAHGFHFYDGAPVKNWVLFYPVEKFLSKWTDVLITINKEDYKRAVERFNAEKTVYIPGVGVDVGKFANTQVDIKMKRMEFGVPENAFLLLSVGELNINKNHQIVLKALARLNDKTIHYVIAGQGDQKSSLTVLAKQLGIEKQLHLLGYRKDVAELYKAADVYLLPSIREGLNVSAIEAMASGLPCIVSDIRGNRDLIDDEKGGFLTRPLDSKGFAEKVKLVKNGQEDYGLYNSKKANEFSIALINSKMSEIYNFV